MERGCPARSNLDSRIRARNSMRFGLSNGLRLRQPCSTGSKNEFSTRFPFVSLGQADRPVVFLSPITQQRLDENQFAFGGNGLTGGNVSLPGNLQAARAGLGIGIKVQLNALVMENKRRC